MQFGHGTKFHTSMSMGCQPVCAATYRKLTFYQALPNLVHMPMNQGIKVLSVARCSTGMTQQTRTGKKRERCCLCGSSTQSGRGANRHVVPAAPCSLPGITLQPTLHHLAVYLASCLSEAGPPGMAMATRRCMGHSRLGSCKRKRKPNKAIHIHIVVHNHPCLWLGSVRCCAGHSHSMEPGVFRPVCNRLW